MSALSSIEWTDSAKVRVVPADESSWPSTGVKFLESAAAVAGAVNCLVRLTWKAPAQSLLALNQSVVSDRRNYLYVLWPVVYSHAVHVMNLFSVRKLAAELRLRHKPMLVNVASNIGQAMATHFHQHITVRCDGATALPIWILNPWLRGHSNQSNTQQPSI